MRDFIAQIEDRYDAIFFDCNPSFSLYTQIALAAEKGVTLSRAEMLRVLVRRGHAALMKKRTPKKS